MNRPSDRPDPKIKELETELKTATSQRKRIDVLNELARVLSRTNMSRALSLAESARQLAQQGEFADQPYREGLAGSLYVLGWINYQRARYADALVYSLDALFIYEPIGTPEQKIEILNNLGDIYLHWGNYSLSLDYFLQELKISREADDHHNEARALNNIGLIYAYLGEPGQALAYSEKTLRICRELGDKKGIADALDNIGCCYFDLNDYPQALKYGQQSLRLYRDIHDRRGETEVLSNLGRTYAAVGDYQNALNHFKRSMRLSREIGSRYEEVGALIAIGKVFVSLGNTARALTILTRALGTAEQIQTQKWLYECHEALADACQRSGDFERALSHYRQFHTIKEDVFNEQADNRLKGMRATYEAETARHEAEIQRLRNIELKQKIEESDHLIAELDAYAHTVAHDLRNPLGLITGYSGLLLEDFTATLDTEVLGIVKAIHQTGYKMEAIIRELLTLASVRSQEVIPKPVDMAYVVHEAESRLFGLIAECNPEIIKPVEWIPALGHAPWVEEVWTNYISNAIKYGGNPSRVELGASLQPDGMVRYWVHDNGQGISPQDQSRLFVNFERLEQTRSDGNGLGLAIVKRIVEKFGGRVGVESIPGQGSTFSFTLPALKSQS